MRRKILALLTAVGLAVGTMLVSVVPAQAYFLAPPIACVSGTPTFTYYQVTGSVYSWTGSNSVTCNYQSTVQSRNVEMYVKYKLLRTGTLSTVAEKNSTTKAWSPLPTPSASANRSASASFTCVHGERYWVTSETYYRFIRSGTWSAWDVFDEYQLRPSNKYFVC